MPVIIEADAFAVHSELNAEVLLKRKVLRKIGTVLKDVD